MATDIIEGISAFFALMTVVFAFAALREARATGRDTRVTAATIRDLMEFSRRSVELDRLGQVAAALNSVHRAVLPLIARRWVQHQVRDVGTDGDLGQALDQVSSGLQAPEIAAYLDAARQSLQDYQARMLEVDTVRLAVSELETALVPLRTQLPHCFSACGQVQILLAAASGFQPSQDVSLDDRVMNELAEGEREIDGLRDPIAYELRVAKARSSAHRQALSR